MFQQQQIETGPGNINFHVVFRPQFSNQIHYIGVIFSSFSALLYCCCRYWLRYQDTMCPDGIGVMDEGRRSFYRKVFCILMSKCQTTWDARWNWPKIDSGWRLRDTLFPHTSFIIITFVDIDSIWWMLIFVDSALCEMSLSFSINTWSLIIHVLLSLE